MRKVFKTHRLSHADVFTTPLRKAYHSGVRDAAEIVVDDPDGSCESLSNSFQARLLKCFIASYKYARPFSPAQSHSYIYFLNYQNGEPLPFPASDLSSNRRYPRRRGLHPLHPIRHRRFRKFRYRSLSSHD
jgi:hypothetical protein